MQKKALLTNSKMILHPFDRKRALQQLENSKRCFILSCVAILSMSHQKQTMGLAFVYH